MNGVSHANAGDFGPHVPEDKVQYRIRTPYGEGLTIRTRPATKCAPQMRQIELVGWKNALKATNSTQKSPGIVKPAYLYSSDDFPSVTPQVGDEVMSTFGRGKVIDIRKEDDGDKKKTTLVVKLSSWRLANRSRVTCFLQPPDVRVLRSKKIYEMTVHERVEAAFGYKEQAAKEFSKKQYREALHSYAKAIDAVRYVQHKSDSDNFVRADLLVVMVTCTNNAAMCAKHLEQWEETFKFAKNAEVLLNAIENKKGMKIYKILVADGYDDVKLFGEWKVKSLVLQARSLIEKQETNQAMDILKQAHEIIASYMAQLDATKHAASIKTLRSLEKEVKRLHTQCKNFRAVFLKKEKQRAAAMFGGSNNHSNKSESSSSSSENPAEPTPLTNGVQKTKDKENQAPNDSPKKQSKASSDSSPHAIETIPLKDSPTSKLEERPMVNGDGQPFKRRVSFSEKVTSYQIPDLEDNNDDIDDRAIPPPSPDGAKEIPWYQDEEVLLGAAIFGGAILASSFLVSALLRKRY